MPCQNNNADCYRTTRRLGSHCSQRASIIAAVFAVACLFSTVSGAFLPGRLDHAPLALALLPRRGLTRSQASRNLCISGIPRGGSSKEGAEEDEDTEEDEEEDDSLETTEADEAQEEMGVQIELNVEKFDEPWVASPFGSLYASLGVMLLARKVDLFHPTVVRIARFAYIAFLVLQQLFLLYVRVQAKINNDRTPIQLTNPLSSLMHGPLGDAIGGGGGMVKDLASSFLSSSSTVLEYDIKQALGMQSGLIFNMLFMWFLHFKMQQVQPLIIQTVNGLQSLVYSPLFQIYILGRNLKRPFENPAIKNATESDATESVTAVDEGTDAVDEEDGDEEDAEEDDNDDEPENDIDDEDASEKATTADDASDSNETETIADDDE